MVCSQSRTDTISLLIWVQIVRKGKIISKEQKLPLARLKDQDYNKSEKFSDFVVAGRDGCSHKSSCSLNHYIF